VVTRKSIHAHQEKLTTAEGFDIHTELERVLHGVGLSQDDCGGRISFVGADPITPSPLRLGTAAGIGLAVKAVAMAKLWQLRGGNGQDIAIDLRKAPHRLCPIYDQKWEKLNGYSPGAPSDPENPYVFDFYQCNDDRWVMPLNPYPRLRVSTNRLLGCSDNAASVARAIRKWKALDLEEAGAEMGVVMPMVRTIEEFVKEPQYDVLAKTGLVEIEKIADSDPIPLPKRGPNPLPLEGFRALGMARVIAGTGTGRALALHGADVLNLWRPSDYEFPMLYYSANVGMRSSTLDFKSSEGRKVTEGLLRDADIFFANHRWNFLEDAGYSAERCAEISPGIIYNAITLHGRSGPWVNRIGFDQTAGCVSGVMTLEGSPEKPQLPMISVVNDYIMAWLNTMGIVEALMRRATEGGSYRVHVSLTRVSLWILELGIFDKEWAHTTAGSAEQHRYLDPDVFQAITPCGDYQGVTDQTFMSETPGEYKTVLVPRGSCRPEWLAR
jgi:crotonobetainyl-CoA:carnitine CoA-transferase CaiB-like acyl-CoA transferase